MHTGDLGMMDSDGFVYFRQRIKRMIITSGYNVYPSQIENILDAHEYVHMSCVIGVKDPYKMQKVKAFVMLKQGVQPSDEVKKALLDYCRTRIAKYAMPYDIEFRSELPRRWLARSPTACSRRRNRKRNRRLDAANDRREGRLSFFCNAAVDLQD